MIQCLAPNYYCPDHAAQTACVIVGTGLLSLVSMASFFTYLTRLDIAADRLRNVTIKTAGELQEKCIKVFADKFCAGSIDACKFDAKAKVFGSKSPFQCVLDVSDEVLANVAPEGCACDEDTCFEITNSKN